MPPQSHESPLALQAGFMPAVALHQQGRLADAEAIYEEILRQQPDHFDALHLLGVVALQTGRAERSAELIGRAIGLKSDFAEAHNNYGNALCALGRQEEALCCYDRAIALKAEYAEAHGNRGNALRELGRYDEALVSCDNAIALRRDFAEAHSNRGLVLGSLGRHQEALASCDRAIALLPHFADAHCNRGNALRDLGRLAEALASFETAIALKADFAEPHNNRSAVLSDLHRYEDALASSQTAIALKPDYAQAYSNRGGILSELQRREDALASYAKALALKPDYAEARSNLLFHLNSGAEMTAEALAEAHRDWNRFHAPAPAFQHAGRADPDRRLRIGYVSPDFREHSVAYFLRPLLAAHDRRRVEIFCYSDVARPDEVTRRLQDEADRWIEICGSTDSAVAERICGDGIDILVDLAGHTAGNRLPVFALKPAPVQMTWLGYPNTTGLTAIDYRITDAIADPSGADRFHSETLLRLPRCFLCFADDRAGPVAALPAPTAGCITFGSFNVLTKVTPQVVDAWSRILHRVAGARLFLKAKTLGDPATRERVLSSFVARGIARDRIRLSGWTASPRDHLALYGEVDIGLDTFPYNGTTTTCQALWMGVPVVTLAGDRHAARVGASLLAAAGLPEFLAADGDDYVTIAATLAADLDRLAALRAGLRQRLRASPLCDAGDFARAMEDAFRAAWRRRCSRTGSSG